MKVILSVMLAAAAVLAVPMMADAAERITVAILPVTVEAKDKPDGFDPADYVQDQMIVGMNKVERFDVLIAGDVRRLLEENLFKTVDVKLENAGDIAEALKVRLLLFPVISKLSLQVETEDRVLVQTRVAVCTVSVGATLFDARTKKAEKIGPYAEEQRRMAAEAELKRYGITSRMTEEMVKTALGDAAKRVRARIYTRYPLAGKISLVDGKVITIDIGTKMGVAAGHKYVITGMVERENPVTGLKERVREEVSVVQVDEVTEESATCHVVSGEPNPLVGSTVVRSLKE